MYVCAYMRVRARVCVHVCDVCVCARMHVCVRVRSLIGMGVYACVCVHACMHACVLYGSSVSLCGGVFFACRWGEGSTK